MDKEMVKIAFSDWINRFDDEDLELNIYATSFEVKWNDE